MNDYWITSGKRCRAVHNDQGGCLYDMLKKLALNLPFIPNKFRGFAGAKIHQKRLINE